MLDKIENLVRVKDWAHSLGLPVLGFVLFAGLNIYNMNFVLTLLISSFLLGFAHSYSTCFDTVKLKKLKSMPDFKTSLSISLTLLSLSLLFSFAMSLQVLTLSFLAVMVVLLYSTPGINLKSKPFAGLLLNALGFSILFLIGNYGAASKIDLPLGFLVFLTMIPFQLVHELQDTREDTQRGYRTTAIVLGEKIARRLVYISLFILSLWSIVLYVLEYTILIAFSTFILSLFGGLFLYKTKNIRKAHFRYLAFAYGLMLLSIFLLN